LEVIFPIHPKLYKSTSQFFDYIWTEMYEEPQNFGSDIYVAYYTAQCVQMCARYTHGLYDYIM